MTVGEVADYLKIPAETVYRHVRSGSLPAAKVGRHWRFSRLEIDRWVSQHSNRPRRLNRAMVIAADPAVRTSLTQWLAETGYDVSTVLNVEEARPLLTFSPLTDLLVLDWPADSTKAERPIQMLQEMQPGATIVILAAEYSGALMKQAFNRGPLIALKKPVEKDAFLAVVRVPVRMVHAKDHFVSHDAKTTA